MHVYVVVFIGLCFNICAICDGVRVKEDPGVFQPGVSNANGSQTLTSRNCDGYKCKTGECLAKKKVCNGVKDCKNGEDEEDCVGISVFNCTSGEPIGDLNDCDGFVDCEDGSDETEECKERVFCPGYTFTCAYGACIDKPKKCNGKKDCWDGSDELNCSNVLNNGFKCKSGEFIDIDKHCNGVEDCEDGSDETESCKVDVICPGYTFTCEYGACIDKYKRCDGKPDCKDGSDEKNCSRSPIPSVVSPTPRQTSSEPPGNTKGCYLPKYPTNGLWALETDTDPLRILQQYIWVEPGTIVSLRCKEGYKASFSSLWCSARGWVDKDLPICEKLCDLIESNDSMNVTCYGKNSITPIPCNETVDGSYLKYNCNTFYQPVDKLDTKRFCVDGKWNVKPRCIPGCGSKTVHGVPYIVRGRDAAKNSYPWATQIYYRNESGKMELVCGGSLLTLKTIVTAAHCVTDEDDGTLLPLDIFEVAVGKYYSDYYKKEPDAQFSKIRAVRKPLGYKGARKRFENDIALLILVKTFVLSTTVQPVCFINLPLIARTGNGTVIGWGYTKPGGKPSDVLKVIEYPYKNYSTCLAELPESFADNYLSVDKFCSGYHNKGISVCRGDSGGGFVFPNRGDEDEFYVHGIVSVGKKDNGVCDVNQNALFTDVKFHYDWILNNWEDVNY